MTSYTSPVGRVVQGSVLEMSAPRNKDGTPKLDKKTGQPGAPRAFLAVAFAKTQAAWWLEPDPFWALLYNEGRGAFPHLFGPDGRCNHPRFAWKVMDGDGVDNDGHSNATKEGFAGHWIVKFGSMFAPKLIHNGAYIDQKDYVKRGYFVRVFGDTVGNAPAEVPGLYINHAGVEMMGYGPEIKSGPDVLALAAASRPAVMPAGMSAVPLAGAGPAPVMPGNGVAGPAGMAPPPAMGGFNPPPALAMAATVATPPPAAVNMAPPPAMAPAGMAPPGVTPNHAFVTNATMPALTPPPAVVAAPVYGPGPNAQGFTPDQWMAQGHPAETLVAQGIIVRTA